MMHPARSDRILSTHVSRSKGIFTGNVQHIYLWYEFWYYLLKITAVSSRNNVNWPIHYNNQLMVVEQYFTDIAALQNIGVSWQIWPHEIYGAYYWYVKISQCGNMEHGLKDLAFYVQKHIASWAVCNNFPLVRDKPLGVPVFVRLVYESIKLAVHWLSTSNPRSHWTTHFFLV